jgi:hypothetical protein
MTHGLKEIGRRNSLTICLVLSGLLLVVPIANVSSAVSSGSSATKTWQNEAMNSPVPGVGCYTATFPNLVWTETTCSNRTSIQYATVGGNGGFDMIGSTTSNMGKVDGNVASMSGYSSEYDSSLGPTNGANTYSIQLNSEVWSCVYGGHNTQCWEQFVFQNYGHGGSAYVSISYMLGNNYGGLYGCPSSSWGNVAGNCYYVPFTLSTSVESISTLASQPIQLQGTANYHVNSGYDVVTMCDSFQCWSVTNYDNAVFAGSGNVYSLYNNWNAFEWNVFGVCCSDGALFNTGPSPSLSINVGSVVDSSGNALTTSCTSAPTTTGEYNNLNLVSGSCSTGSGYLSFQEH